jgi:hypothetical protein
MKTLKEKDIVNHLYDNWNKYFPNLIGCRKEFTIRDSRVDILSSQKTDLYKLGIKSKDDKLRYINAAVFVEIKYNENHRDLVYELQKHINFRDWYIKYGKAYCLIMTISDEYDPYITKFIRDNKIIAYKYSIENNDLNTFKIWKY